MIVVVVVVIVNEHDIATIMTIPTHIMRIPAMTITFITTTFDNQS